jgi:hypothetical protein
MYHEFANVCSYEQFLAVFKAATSEPHSFLTIDLNPTNEMQRFRRNFDTALVLPPKSDTSLNKSKKRKVSLEDVGSVDGSGDP